MSDKIAIDLKYLDGRKKIYAVLPYQARLIVSFMADGKERKESEIIDNIRTGWGRDSLDRGRITHFCRCVKDSEKRFMFVVSGERPRSIRYVPWDER